MIWLEIIRTFWPVAVVLLPIILAGGFAWLGKKFPSAADFEKQSDKIGDISNRLLVAEGNIETIIKDIDREPSKVKLTEEISDIRERLGGLESGFQSLLRQLETQNSYLHTLVDQGMRNK